MDTVLLFASALKLTTGPPLESSSNMKINRQLTTGYHRPQVSSL